MSTSVTLQHRIVNAFARTVLGGARLLPYPVRVALVGRVFRSVSPLAGWRSRVRKNLAYVYPEMDSKERDRIAARVADNVGRTLIEIYSGQDFVTRALTSEVGGPGWPELQAARDSGRPLVLATGHLGNYDAVRSKLSREGFPMAALYRPMANPLFNAHYVKAISAIAEPVFPTDGKGIAALVRHLREGGTIGIVADVGSRKAPLLEFFGKPAQTPVSAAEWAVRYDALMVPVFGLRQPDGLTFRLHVAKPIPNGEPEAMMQSFNDTAEAIIREHPDQWFWIHRRWKLSAGARAISGATPP